MNMKFFVLSISAMIWSSLVLAEHEYIDPPIPVGTAPKDPTIQCTVRTTDLVQNIQPGKYFLFNEKGGQSLQLISLGASGKGRSVVLDMRAVNHENGKSPIGESNWQVVNYVYEIKDYKLDDIHSLKDLDPTKLTPLKFYPLKDEQEFQSLHGKVTEVLRSLNNFEVGSTSNTVVNVDKVAIEIDCDYLDKDHASYHAGPIQGEVK